MALDKEIQIKLAEQFTAMHRTDKMFILPNIWNAGTAKIFEKEGYKAVATTSAGIAFTLGYSDGEHVDIHDLCTVVKQITDKISIPLSVDMERGYGTTTDEVCSSVKKVINSGAVGINIEDGYDTETPYLENIDRQAEKIKAVVTLKKTTGIPFVINARTCAFWLNVNESNNLLDIAINRCNRYIDAGADSVFIPGALTKDQVTTLINNINAPVNIIANPVFNNISELEEIGVKRLSLGSGVVRASFDGIITMAKDIVCNNSLDSLMQNDFTYKKANNYFK
ncbi:MAG: isocitrate lyase/phosphoenolpyruvate mutase family protein [Bacteroidales bacterium]|jgi:2-methylisocitrate lyase-like PEP mutase family enzyme|nr:isocitrate lyase/phosphoenolpyruvate mutase family protein [Bacteroidales bacterium]